MMNILRGEGFKDVQVAESTLSKPFCKFRSRLEMDNTTIVFERLTTSGEPLCQTFDDVVEDKP